MRNCVNCSIEQLSSFEQSENVKCSLPMIDCTFTLLIVRTSIVIKHWFLGGKVQKCQIQVETWSDVANLSNNVVQQEIGSE